MVFCDTKYKREREYFKNVIVCWKVLILHYKEWTGKELIIKMAFYLHARVFFGICIRKNVISTPIEMQPFQCRQNITIPCIIRLKAVEPLSGRMKSFLWKSFIWNLQITIFETDREFSCSFWKWLLLIDNSY